MRLMVAHKQLLDRVRAAAGTTPGIVLAFALATGAAIALSDLLTAGLIQSGAWLGYLLVLKFLLIAALTAMALVLFLRRNTSQEAVMQKELYLAQHDPSTNLFR